MSKKVIILGGSSGIGKATATRFAQEGWQVLVSSASLEKCKAVVAHLNGNNHIAVRLDVSKNEDIANVYEKVKFGWQTFDVIINSVGISKEYSVIDSDFDDWDTALQIMMYGPVKAIRTLVPLMNDGGRIINITSIHHDRVADGSSAYGMAKAAMTQFTRSLAVELAHRNILANAIAPGFINTPMSVRENGLNEIDTEWFKVNYVDGDHLPLKRAGRPDEIAGVAWFLAGPDSSYMTGSVLTVDGGLTTTF